MPYYKCYWTILCVKIDNCSYVIDSSDVWDNPMLLISVLSNVQLFPLITNKSFNPSSTAWIHSFVNSSLSWNVGWTIFEISHLISHIFSFFQRVLRVMHDLCDRFFLLLLLIGSLLSLSLTFIHSLLLALSSAGFIK